MNHTLYIAEIGFILLECVKKKTYKQLSVEVIRGLSMCSMKWFEIIMPLTSF